MVIADALGHTRGAGAPTALTAVLAEREGLGQIALQSLGRLRDRDTLIPILNELKNRGDDFEFQLAVLEVIGLMPEPPPADDLLALGQHREADFRIQWLLCVKNFLNDPAVLRGVLKYFDDPDWQVRQAAIEIIGGFRNFDVIDTLIRRLAEEPEKALRPIIRERLALITGSDYGDDVAVWQEYWKQAKDRWHELEKAGNTAAIEAFEARLDEAEFAVYRIRRVYFGKGCAHRKVERLETGSRQEIEKLIARRAVETGTKVTHEAGVPRVYSARRGESYPTTEDMLVACPATVADKARKSFDKTWARVTTELAEAAVA